MSDTSDTSGTHDPDRCDNCGAPAADHPNSGFVKCRDGSLACAKFVNPPADAPLSSSGGEDLIDELLKHLNTEANEWRYKDQDELAIRTEQWICAIKSVRASVGSETPPPADPNMDPHHATLRGQLTTFVQGERGLRDYRGGQSVGGSPSITPSVLKKLEWMLANSSDGAASVGSDAPADKEAQEEVNLAGALGSFAARLLNEQKSLPPAAAQVLRENLFSLYEIATAQSDVPSPALASPGSVAPADTENVMTQLYEHPDTRYWRERAEALQAQLSMRTSPALASPGREAALQEMTQQRDRWLKAFNHLSARFQEGLRASELVRPLIAAHADYDRGKGEAVSIETHPRLCVLLDAVDEFVEELARASHFEPLAGREAALRTLIEKWDKEDVDLKASGLGRKSGVASRHARELEALLAIQPSQEGTK